MKARLELGHLQRLREYISKLKLRRSLVLQAHVAVLDRLMCEVLTCPETPDPRLQKQYRSMVAKIRFAAHWIRFDISYAAAQLAQFCASGGRDRAKHIQLLKEQFCPARINEPKWQDFF